MVVIEVFRSPFASTISLDGYNHQYQSYCGSKRNDFRTHFKFMKCTRCLNGEPKANKSSTRIHGRIVVAIAEECEILSRTANRRMPRMGANDFGQLGDGTERARKHPKKVKQLQSEFVISVSCGAHCTAAIAEPRENDGTISTRRLWIWGQNQVLEPAIFFIEDGKRVPAV